MRKCQSIIALHSASDLFVRDIRAIKKPECYWKVIAPHELVWHTQEGDIGWCLVGSRLERTEGLYDQKWKNKTTSVVAAGIAQVTFTVEKSKGHIVGVECSFIPVVDPKKPIVCYVAVRQKGIV